LSEKSRPTTRWRIGVLLVVLAVLSACSSATSTGTAGTTPAPTPDRPIRYMPLGDSITEGYPGKAGGYRTVLWQHLVQQDGDLIDFVGSQSGGPPELGDRDHEGHGGWCIDGPCGGHRERDVAPKIKGLIEQYRPDIISVHLGTNDLNKGAGGVETARRLDRLVGSIYAADPDVHLILVQIVATHDRPEQHTIYAGTFPGIADRYRAQGRSLTVVDMSRLLSMPTNFVDGIHPTQFGYDVMGRALYPAVAAAYRELA
jgi:lysophospholipase L1-like esterase